jgi:thymidine phosphorylase
MNANLLIEKLRKRDKLSPEEARWIGRNIAGDTFSDAQVGALAMAICINGIDVEARVALTIGMRDSGDVLTWQLPGPVLDKHSTGGVGDPVSLILAPALAACGAYVPMISGRGLGHTGGTLDKLEAIPGYTCEINEQRLNQVVSKVGCAIAGSSRRIAPSDKRLYAIRDVTGTVNSLDLITASILSKKLAAGLEGLVLDVKCGSGAFMKTPNEAKELAQSLIDVSNGAGCPTTALITDMSQPLANAAGNALEITAVMKVLAGEDKTSRLQTVVCELGGHILSSSGMVNTVEIGKERIQSVLADGAALTRFSEMVAAMGGPKGFETSWRNSMPEAPVQREVVIGKSGYVSSIDTLTLGQTIVSLGGGRMKETDKIDPSVGLSNILSIGANVNQHTAVAMVHARSENDADQAIAKIRHSFNIEEEKPIEVNPILESLGHDA